MFKRARVAKRAGWARVVVGRLPPPLAALPRLLAVGAPYPGQAAGDGTRL